MSIIGIKIIRVSRHRDRDPTSLSYRVYPNFQAYYKFMDYLSLFGFNVMPILILFILNVKLIITLRRVVDQDISRNTNGDIYLNSIQGNQGPILVSNVCKFSNLKISLLKRNFFKNSSIIRKFFKNSDIKTKLFSKSSDIKAKTFQKFWY